MTREEFMEAYRNDNELIESLSSEDCKEIFTTVLKGSTDITVGLIEELISEYEFNKITMFTRMSAYDLIEELRPIGSYDPFVDNPAILRKYIRNACILMKSNQTRLYQILGNMFREHTTKSNIFDGYIIDNIDIEYYSNDSIVLRQTDSMVDIRFRDIATFREMFQYDFTLLIK